MRLATALLLAVSVSGCVSTTDPNAPFSTVRVQQLGTNQYMVSCVDSQAYCAAQANTLCADYDVVNFSNNPADFGRMTMIIRCR